VIIYKQCFPGIGWQILKKISPLMREYQSVLAGGTALAMQIGHRESVDLDYFTMKDFDVENLISRLQKIKLPFNLQDYKQNYLVAYLNKVKLSVFVYPYPFIEENQIGINKNSTGAEFIRIAGIKDIAAMKVISITQRGLKKDFVDLFFILNKKWASSREIAEQMVLKFGIERINPIIIGKALTYFDDADNNPEPKYLPGQSILWEDIKCYFTANAKHIIDEIARVVKNHEQISQEKDFPNSTPSARKP
jgi:hypothetical protein